MRKCKFYIDGKSPFSIVAVVLMGLCAALRVLYYWGRPTPPIEFWICYVNVLAACVLFGIAVLAFGQRLPQLICLPVAMGVVFFAVKAFWFESWLQTVLCLILYTGVLVLFCLTLFGVIPTKRLLYPLFGLPFLYHIFVEDMQIYILADPPVPFHEWLPELSVLCIMAALFFLSIGMKKEKNAPECG